MKYHVCIYSNDPNEFGWYQPTFAEVPDFREAIQDRDLLRKRGSHATVEDELGIIYRRNGSAYRRAKSELPTLDD